MAVTYTVSSIGLKYKPPRYQYQRQDPYLDSGYYGSINRTPYQDHYYGYAHRDPYLNQEYYGSINKTPYQDDHGYYESDNYQDYGYGYVVINHPWEKSPFSDSIGRNETPEAYVYKAHFPGDKLSTVEVEVEKNNRLLNMKSYKDEEYRCQLVLEVKSIMLPDNSDPAHVKVDKENGVLTVTVPKLNRSINPYVRNFNIY